MPAPTVRFRTIPISTPVLAIDTAAERTATVSGEAIVSTGSGNEVDFGVVDISGGTANSLVKMLIWDFTANGGNTIVDTFKYWISSIGFDIAASVMKYRPISGADQGTPVNTENYIANAITSSYSFTTAPESEPGAQNVYPSDEGASMSITGGASDDVIMVALYSLIGASETTGTYKGVDAGKEYRNSFKFSYS